VVSRLVEIEIQELPNKKQDCKPLHANSAGYRLTVKNSFAL
jgi:hypothetical protein